MTRYMYVRMWTETRADGGYREGAEWQKLCLLNQLAGCL